jgi:hypothetical protein
MGARQPSVDANGSDCRALLEGETSDSLIVIIGVGGARLNGTKQRVVSRSAALPGGFVESRVATSYF